MNLEEQRALDFLARLAERPAVACHEAGVRATVMRILEELGVRMRVDSYGNVIAHFPGRVRSSAPLAFVAHMDHPGFEAVSTQGDNLVCKALGGVPPASFEAGVPMRLVLKDGKGLPAAVVGAQGEGSERRLLIRLSRSLELELPLPVVFDLPDFRLDGDYIRMRAADDLAGCGAILAALAGIGGPTMAPPQDVYGVFTRAEEVGLVGARCLAQSRLLPQDTLVVSIESSRILPGAESGCGPVIRVGDAAMTFSAGAEAVLTRAKEELEAEHNGFKAQRQLMSGGVCEASAFVTEGYLSTGMAFPLGNYHNGDKEGRIEAEHIHKDDYFGGIRLLVKAAHQAPDREDTAFRRRLRSVPDDVRERLIATADGS